MYLLESHKMVLWPETVSYSHLQVRVHAPMTETLSTLNRDQLQKILQYAVQEDPAGILGKLFKYIGMLIIKGWNIDGIILFVLTLMW